MMEFSPASAAKIVLLNNGKLVGKTRFQKSAYFLEELGVGFGFDFDYHYYGPYSEDLSVSLDCATALELVSIDWKKTAEGARFAVFKSDEPQGEDDYDGNRQSILEILDHYNSVVLELAATADYLSKNGFEEDPWKETISRKSEKANSDRIDKAKELLKKLKLN